MSLMKPSLINSFLYLIQCFYDILQLKLFCLQLMYGDQVYCKKDDKALA